MLFYSIGKGKQSCLKPILSTSLHLQKSEGRGSEVWKKCTSGKAFLVLGWAVCLEHATETTTTEKFKL